MYNIFHTKHTYITNQMTYGLNTQDEKSAHFHDILTENSIK